MMKSRCLSFLAILFSVVACAPIRYEASYRSPASHVSTHRSHSHISPIQVTLYSETVQFAPIQIVVSDGDYVEIPVKNRRGRSSRIFAHYHRGNLHFDSNRKCQKIKGSVGYQYDKRWDRGYKYTHVSVGHDYDFSGLRLLIRNTSKLDSRPKKILTVKTPEIHRKTANTTKYQTVKTPAKKKVVARKQLKNTPKKVVMTKKTSNRSIQSHRDKSKNTSDKYRARGAVSAKKPGLMDMVRTSPGHNKADKHKVVVRNKAPDRPSGNRSVATRKSHATNGVKPEQAGSYHTRVNAASSVSKVRMDKGVKGRVLVNKESKDGHSSQGKISQAQETDRSRNQQGPSEVVVMAQPLKKDKQAKAKKNR